MNKGRRAGLDPIPKDLHNYLNSRQVRTLKEIGAFGWKLFCIRRPKFQEPTVIVVGPDGNQFGVLKSNGAVDYHSDIAVRPAPEGKGTE